MPAKGEGLSLNVLATWRTSCKTFFNAYLMMNIIGCFFLILYTFSKKAYANSVLNSIWLLMTVVALVKIYLTL
jgi:hypothetical protein